MKIGFDTTPASPAGTYSQHLARLLARFAPEHEYIVDGKRYSEIDLYHGFRPELPLLVRLRNIPSVVTVHNLNFLRYPHLYSLPERLVLLRLYRRALRAASRLITVNRDAREELSERLRIDPRKIEVVMPLAAQVPQEPPAQEELEAVRRKYMLPNDFILMLGTVEPRHNHEMVFEALFVLRDQAREQQEAAAGSGNAGVGSGNAGAGSGNAGAAERSEGTRQPGQKASEPENSDVRASGRSGEAAASAAPSSVRGFSAETFSAGASFVGEPFAAPVPNASSSAAPIRGISSAAGKPYSTVTSSGGPVSGVTSSAVSSSDASVSAKDSATVPFSSASSSSAPSSPVPFSSASSSSAPSSDASVPGSASSSGVSFAAAPGAFCRTEAWQVGVVVCGRRTAYSDFLLGYTRARHMAARVDFIYELTPDDLPALFRLARAFVYLPDAECEASIVPVVEALRAGLPMVLSDTQLNREAAGDAALYVRSEAVGEVAAALENVLCDENFRREMQARERRRAELFSEYAVARRLIDIYSSL